MKNTRLHFSAKLATVLVAGLPLAAQSPDASTNILKGFSHAPLHRFAAPAAGPTGYSPNDLKKAYGFSSIKNGGQGQVIGIIDAYDDPQAEADLGTFSTEFSLPACTTANGCFKVLYQSGATKPPADTAGWSDEVAIDTQWAHAMAPYAKILLVESNSNSNADLYAAVDVAVANGATIVSMSWSGGEASDETSSDVHFNVPGVTFVASSGDGGHGAQYPVASPYVVGVGGTTLGINTSTGAWMSETSWSSSGGGLSKYEPEPGYQAHSQTSGKRGIPDVAYDGNPNTGVPSYSSHSCSVCYTGWNQWGGTSIGTPQWAALFAIANSIRVLGGKSNLTQPQVYLYPRAETEYHDITTGTNGSCGTQCTAKTGYDLVTGIGSPKVNLVVPALVAAP